MLVYWLGGAGGGSDTVMGTLGSGGGDVGIGGETEENSRGGLSGGLGGGIAEKSNGPLVDVGTVRYWTGGDLLRENCCGFVCLVLS